MPRRKSVPIKHNSPKRRFAGRKRSARKAISGINYSRHRLVNVRGITTGPNADQYDLTIPWQQVPNNAPGLNSFSFNQSVRWSVVRPNWDEYAITSLKIEWMPTQRYPDSQDPYIGALWKADTPSDYGTIYNSTDAQLAVLPGFKALNTQRGWKRFISVKKLSKQQNVAWQKNSDYTSGVANGLTKAATHLRFFITNPAASGNTTWGTLKVTWYLKMRGQVNP